MTIAAAQRRLETSRPSEESGAMARREQRSEDAELAPHIEATVRSVADLQAEHHKNATPLQRTLDGFTCRLAQPWFIVALTLLIAGWVGLNLLAPSFGYRPLDPAPFVWLNIAVSIGSFYLMYLIYVTQRRDDQLAELREQLALQLALLNEQKTAKVIGLLEEFRRDIPLVHNRVDEQAEAMSEPADPNRVLDAIKENHAEAERIRIGR